MQSTAKLAFDAGAVTCHEPTSEKASLIACAAGCRRHIVIAVAVAAATPQVARKYLARAQLTTDRTHIPHIIALRETPASCAAGAMFKSPQHDCSLGCSLLCFKNRPLSSIAVQTILIH